MAIRLGISMRTALFKTRTGKCTLSIERLAALAMIFSNSCLRLSGRPSVQNGYAANSGLSDTASRFRRKATGRSWLYLDIEVSPFHVFQRLIQWAVEDAHEILFAGCLLRRAIEVRAEDPQHTHDQASTFSISRLQIGRMWSKFSIAEKDLRSTATTHQPPDDLPHRD